MAEHEHEHGSELTDLELRVRTLESLLVEKGIVDPAAIDLLVETYETQIGPHHGARVVARAWTDAAFRKRLLDDATQAVLEYQLPGAPAAKLVALENTSTVHNLVVCTLCSCYPTQLLGLPPVWYKSAPYRSRAALDPRGVLCEMGLELPTDVEVRVWDSTSEVRYLVLPQRPAGTEGWSQEQLAAIVTRDSMIGAARVCVP
jgi:nitrile hydratase